MGIKFFLFEKSAFDRVVFIIGVVWLFFIIVVSVMYRLLTYFKSSFKGVPTLFLVAVFGVVFCANASWAEHKTEKGGDNPAKRSSEWASPLTRKAHDHAKKARKRYAFRVTLQTDFGAPSVEPSAFNFEEEERYLDDLDRLVHKLSGPLNPLNFEPSSDPDEQDPVIPMRVFGKLLAKQFYSNLVDRWPDLNGVTQVVGISGVNSSQEKREAVDTGMGMGFRLHWRPNHPTVIGMDLVPTSSVPFLGNTLNKIKLAGKFSGGGERLKAVYNFNERVSAEVLSSSERDAFMFTYSKSF